MTAAVTTAAERFWRAPEDRIVLPKPLKPWRRVSKVPRVSGHLHRASSLSQTLAWVAWIMARASRPFAVEALACELGAAGA